MYLCRGLVEESPTPRGLRQVSPSISYIRHGIGRRRAHGCRAIQKCCHPKSDWNYTVVAPGPRVETSGQGFRPVPSLVIVAAAQCRLLGHIIIQRRRVVNGSRMGKQGTSQRVTALTGTTPSDERCPSPSVAAPGFACFREDTEERVATDQQRPRGLIAVDKKTAVVEKV